MSDKMREAFEAEFPAPEQSDIEFYPDRDQYLSRIEMWKPTARGRTHAWHGFKAGYQAAQRQGGEAVGEIDHESSTHTAWFDDVREYPQGTKLYTAPQPAVPEGSRLVQIGTSGEGPIYVIRPEPPQPQPDWIACSEVIQAVEDEPELPDEMPEEMWERMFKGKEHAMIALRATVRETKRGIRERIERLKRPEPPEDA